MTPASGMTAPPMDLTPELVGRPALIPAHFSFAISVMAAAGALGLKPLII